MPRTVKTKSVVAGSEPKKVFVNLAVSTSAAFSAQYHSRGVIRSRGLSEDIIPAPGTEGPVFFDSWMYRNVIGIYPLCVTSTMGANPDMSGRARSRGKMTLAV
jgi:hypothetical protein